MPAARSRASSGPRRTRSRRVVYRTWDILERPYPGTHLQVRESIIVGTSSWADPGFVEEWYPPGLPARDRLPYYAERFDAVEVNATFYALPAPRTVQRWAEITPPGFTFDVKLHRLL